MSETKSFLLGLGAILIAATLFGIAGALAKVLFHANLSPIDLTALRTLLACALFAAIIAASPRLSFKPARSAWPILIAAGVVFTLVNVTFYLSISMISVAGAITLEYTAPFFVLLIAFIAGTRRIDVADIAIVLASVFGCFLLAWDGGGDWFYLSPGILTGLACGLSFAVYNMIGNACKSRDIGTTTVAFYSFFFSAVLWLLALPFLGLHEMTIDIKSAFYIGFIVIFATTIPYWLLLYGLRHVHALPATVTGMLDPLTAGVFAFWLLGEVLTVANLTGIAVILMAICLLTAKEAKKEMSK